MEIPMKKEKWIKWEPVAKIPQTLLLDNIQYDCNNLSISLYNPENRSQILNIVFDGFLAFRSMDESKYSSWYDIEYDQVLTDMELEPNSLQKWSLFTVENSRFVNWFLNQTGGVHDEDPIIHYLIVTPADAVEILDIEGFDLPIVKWN